MRKEYIERLIWHDAEEIKPPHDGNVLLLVRDARPFRTPTWAVGWWDGHEWLFSLGGVRQIVLYWSEPDGPSK